MKCLIILTTLFGYQVYGYLIEIPKNPQPNIATSGWIHKQKLILWLFDDICETSSNPTIIRLANEFSLEGFDCGKSQCDAVTNLQTKLNGIKLKLRGEIFSEFNENDMLEMKIIYNLLYSAKNFDEFFRAAAWARQNVNCGIFLDALYAALLHRRDTEKIAIPPPYELLANYFVNKNVLRQIMAIDEGQIATSNVQFEGNVYTIFQNYTSDFVESQEETKLAYLLEDVGLNSYYFLKRLQSTVSVENQNMTDARSEFWYHVIKQLIARIDLERYSNGFSNIGEFNSLTQYDSMLMYSNGNEFPQEYLPEDFANKPEYVHVISIIQDFMTNKYSMSGSEYVNRFISNFFFNNSNYEATIIRLFRNDPAAVNSLPTVLEHYMTMLRNPMYWRLLKSIVVTVDQALQTLPRYSRNELYFPGVDISNVVIKKCSTYFEFFDIDVTNALHSNFKKVLSNLHVKVSQPRLNHKPFTLKLYINSQSVQKGLVKVYLVPKVLPTQLSTSSFFLLDSFEYNLKMGVNVITRSSEQFKASGDLLSMTTLTKNIEDAEFGLDTMPLNNIESYINFPSRLLIPKGSTTGIPFQLFIFVAPFTKASTENIYSTEFNSAILSPSYPFDLVDDISTLFTLPNSMFKEILITHKGDEKVFTYGAKDDESSNKWSGNAYDYSSKKKSDYDYKAKKEKYAKKNDDKIEETITEAYATSVPEDDLLYEKMINNTPEKVININEDAPTYTYIDGLHDNSGKEIEDELEEPPKYKFKRPPSVFDMYRNLDYSNYDYEDDRVYE